MSTIKDLWNYLQKADLTKINIEVDGDNKATVSSFSIDPLASVDAGALVMELNLVTNDGISHNAKLQSNFSRHSDKNTVIWDGKEATNVIWDFDEMGLNPQEECRFNVTAENTGAAIPDNEVTFQAGEGNHQIRFKF